MDRRPRARPRASRLIVLGLVCSLVAPATAAGSHPFHEGSGCGRWYRRWRTTHQCSFWFHGFPITVYGNARSAGRANVRVWVTTSVAGQDLALLECSRSDSRYASCDGIQPEMDPLVDLQVEQVSLTCHVAGRSRGQYWCVSGGGTPVPP